MEELGKAYDRLIANPDYVDFVQRTTANEERVRGRLALTKAAFSEVS